MQVRRRRSEHELGGNPIGQIVQHDVFGQEVARACRPRYRIEPHSFGFTHIGASVLRGLDAPQWNAVTTGFDLGMWTGVLRGSMFMPMSRGGSYAD